MKTLQDRVEALAWRMYQSSVIDPALDHDDLIQVGMLAVQSAKRHYHDCRGASIETYSLICARTSMIDVIRKSKKTRFNTELSEISEVVRPVDDFMLMVDEMCQLDLSAAASKLLFGTLNCAENLDRCTLRELRRYLGMTPREFCMAREELEHKKLCLAG